MSIPGPYVTVGMADPVDIGRWIHGGFNVLEAAIWLTASVYLAVLAFRPGVRDRRAALIASAALLAFAASDVWEVFTGAWFRPLGLLLLKSSCVAVLLPCLAYYGCRRRVRCR